MILDCVGHPVIHFCRVMLYVPSKNQDASILTKGLMYDVFVAHHIF